MARTPKVNALVVSQDATKDPRTGRLDLIGVIETARSPQFPIRFDGLTVFVSLTNLQGSYRLAIEVVDLEKDEKLTSVAQGGPFTWNDPTKVWTEVARVGPFEVEHPGRFACRLLLNDDYLHEVVFSVVSEPDR